MKMTKSLIAALLVSTATFAQESGSSKNTHGATINTAAKSETEVGMKGQVVSAEASINATSRIEGNAISKGKSEAAQELKNDLIEQKSEIKAVIKENQEARKEELAALKTELKADSKASLEASKAEIKELRSEFKANKDASLHTAHEAVVKPSVNIKKSLKTTTKLHIRPVHVSNHSRLRSKLGVL